MNVNGVTSTQAAYGSYTATARETAAETTKNTSTAEDTGVVYEHSTETASSTKKTYSPNTNLINQLKADAEARTSQLKSLVEKMMTQQSTAYGQANDIWQFLKRQLQGGSRDTSAGAEGHCGGRLLGGKADF